VKGVTARAAPAYRMSRTDAGIALFIICTLRSNIVAGSLFRFSVLEIFLLQFSLLEFSLLQFSFLFLGFSGKPAACASHSAKPETQTFNAPRNSVIRV
jgi:hypothetical protein